MKLQKATVELVKSTSSSDYRLTIYIGIQCEQGPSTPVLVKTLREFYTYFNSHEKTESYKTAEFCLKHGYNVLALRVNTITGRASSRKFILSDGSSVFYSPKEGVDYSDNNLAFLPKVSLKLEDQVYSEIVTFNDDITSGYANEKFVLLIPKMLVVSGEGSRFVYYCLAGEGWTQDELLTKYALYEGNYKILTHEESNLSNGIFRIAMLSFFEKVCGFTTTQVAGTDNSYELVASTPILEFDTRNNNLQDYDDSEELISYVQSDTGKNDLMCKLYNDYKVCTLYTKYDSSVEDTTVDIVNSVGGYIINVFRTDSDGVTIASEVFQLSSNLDSPDYISSLNNKSSLIDIEIHKQGADFSGTYNLKGQSVLYSDDDFVNSLDLDSDDYSYDADICLDTSVEGNLDYIKKLQKAFPNAIILTDIIADMVKVLTVVPKVKWFDTGDTLRGYTYLLYVLPTDFEGSDNNVIGLDESIEYERSDKIATIEKLDYETNLQGVSLPIQVTSNRLPIKAVLATVAVQDLIVDSQYLSASDFEKQVRQFVSTVNKELNYNLKVNVINANVSGNTLSATLNFYVDTFVISSYRVTTVFNSYV